MRVLVIAAALLAGCASTRTRPPGPDPRIARLEQDIQKIDESENRCISEAVTSSDRQIESTGAGTGAFADHQTQKLADDRDGRVFECRVKAEREREDLTARERADYETHVQEEHDRNSLMTILTTSRPH
jgi:hypothetical protein